jgi:ubiquinone/menaquinone biosynthesis C-methylase UbiE
MADSPTLRSLWQEHAAGADFPQDFFHISFVTLAQLESMQKLLAVGPGDTLVDAGCGLGGPALWMARQTGARLVGVDISAVGVAKAAERASSLGMAEQATFVAGTFEESGLESGSADAIMSEDALQYSPDKRAAFRELARVLRPGGRLVFVAFELEPARVAGQPVLGVDPVSDYRPLLAEAGFTVTSYEETPGWSETVRKTYQSLLDASAALVAEMGAPAAAALASELTMTLEARPYRSRVLVSAVRD